MRESGEKMYNTGLEISTKRLKVLKKLKQLQLLVNIMVSLTEGKNVYYFFKFSTLCSRVQVDVATFFLFDWIFG